MLLKNCIFKCCWQENTIALPRASQCLWEKISFFFGRVGGVCVKCEVTQEGFCEQTWQIMMVGGRWVKNGNFCTIIVLSIYNFLAVLLRKYCSKLVFQFYLIWKYCKELKQHCIHELPKLFKVSFSVLPYLEMP